MKKYIRSIVIVLVLVLVAGLTKDAFANQNRAVGLEDRGPLSKITFIHYRKGYAKPEGVGRGKNKDASSCYGFISKGAKWKTTEDFMVNPSNSGLTDSFVTEAVASSVAEWEIYGGSNIFGELSLNPLASFQFNVMDGNNVLIFDAYGDSSVIGVTNVWGYFYGSPKTRELVEWDMLLNTAFTWGDGVDPTVMDLQNIVTHELGHSAGLTDLYETTCTQETMYGYSSTGDISKRDLFAGDIEGIRKLYQ